MSDLDTTRLSRAARHKLRAVAAEENGRDRLSLRRLVLIQNSMLHTLYRQSSSPLQCEASSSVSPPPLPQPQTLAHPHPHHTSAHHHLHSDMNLDEQHPPIQTDDFVFPDLDFTDPQTLQAEANWLESVLENLDDSDLDFASGAGSGGCLEDEASSDESASDIDMSETWFPSPACPCSFYPFNTCVCHMVDSYPPLPDYDDVPDLDLDSDDDEDSEEYFGPPTPLSTSGLDDEDTEEERSFASEQDSSTYFSTALRPHSRFTPPICDFQMIF